MKVLSEFEKTGLCCLKQYWLNRIIWAVIRENLTLLQCYNLGADQLVSVAEQACLSLT